MSTKVDEILKPALKLRRSERAKVAAELIASLDGPRERDVKDAWAIELAQRIRDVRKKQITLEDWDSVRAEIGRALRTR